MANRHDINLHVPFHDDNSFFCVEYPALVRNHEKMLTTLGNISHVKEVRADRREVQCIYLEVLESLF